MTPQGLAQTHAAAFNGQGWPVADFERYLAGGTALIHGDDSCFAVFAVTGPEAEVLTLACHPDVQTKGQATKMLRAALDDLKTRGVADVFLEVAGDNTAAIALYARCGFTRFAIRANYYANGADAICMKALLSPASPA